MKKILLLLFFLTLVVPAFAENADTLKYFKNFRKINFPSDPTANEETRQLMSMEFLNDTTLISVYMSFVMRTNPRTGEYKIIMNRQHPFYKFVKDEPVFKNISKWKGLCAVSVYSLSTDTLKGTYIYGADGYEKNLLYTDIYKKYRLMFPGEEIKKIYDCKIGGDGKIYVAVKCYDGLRILSSADTGRSWVRGQDVIFKNKQTVMWFEILNILKDGGMEVSFYLYNPNTIGLKDQWIGRSTDYGSTWDPKNLHRFVMYYSYSAYFPIKTYLTGDTTYMFTQTKPSKDTVCINFGNSVNYGKNFDTLKSLNYLTQSFERPNAAPTAKVFHPYRIMLSCDNGIYITRNIGRTWTLYMDQYIRHFGLFAMLDENKGCVHNVDGEYYMFDLEPDPCGEEGVDYADFGSTEGMILKGDAKRQGNDILLTSAKPNQSGGAWIGHSLDLNKRFECNFSYTMNEGSDAGLLDDYTPRGADGVALIISPDAPGDGKSFGMGMGYNTLYRGLAIEFDSYVNDAQSDPKYDHIAVFASDVPIINNHTAKTCLTTIKFDPKFEPNSTLYNFTVEYNSYDSELKVFFNKASYSDIPLIRLKDFNIAKYLDSYGRGYIGLASATGEAFENHFLKNLKVCFEDRSKVVSVENDGFEKQSSDESNVYPNPAGKEVRIMIPDAMICNNLMVRLYNSNGNLISGGLSWQIIDNTVKIDLGDIPAGFYYAALSDGISLFTAVFIKN